MIRTCGVVIVTITLTHTFLWYIATYSHVWGNFILYGHGLVHTCVDKSIDKSLSKKNTLDNIMLATIKLLYIKSPNFISFVAVKFITLARHLQNPPPSPYFMSVCVCTHTCNPVPVQVNRQCDLELELVLSHWVSPWDLTEVIRLQRKHLYTLSSHQPLSSLNATKMRSLRPNLLDTAYPNISGGLVFFAKFQKYSVSDSLALPDYKSGPSQSPGPGHPRTWAGGVWQCLWITSWNDKAYKIFWKSR